MDNNKLIKIGILFYGCSIIGYIHEMLLCFLFNGKFMSHGILYGPWLPIYGTGAVLINLFSKYKKHPLRIFLISFLLTGFLEYICGYLLLKFLDMRLWDYRDWILNIDGFVCFASAFCFGVGGLVIIYLINPLIEKIIKKVNNKFLKVVISLLTGLFIIDVIFTILK